MTQRKKKAACRAQLAVLRVLGVQRTAEGNTAGSLSWDLHHSSKDNLIEEAEETSRLDVLVIRFLGDLLLCDVGGDI